MFTCAHARLILDRRQLTESTLQLLGSVYMLTSLSGIVAWGLGFRAGRNFVRGLRDGSRMCEMFVRVYRLTQYDMIVKYGQSISPFPFVVRCKQHLLLYIYLM
jgi:hypothetical protein